MLMEDLAPYLPYIPHENLHKGRPSMESHIKVKSLDNFVSSSSNLIFILSPISSSSTDEQGHVSSPSTFAVSKEVKIDFTRKSILTV
ncbi:hypothetical protein ACH5RR_026325 [Cinchona calisaya]|uniref:Uncharacterized protein n=1 Tax=Cinchona calisaya TaxID=153742 RepID=A0ABD2Z3B9_9GENT